MTAQNVPATKAIVKRATIVLLSRRGFGTNAIIREARVSKPCVWRWQQAYMEGSVERLLKEKGKGPKAGKTRISEEVRLAIVTRTAKENASKRHTLERADAGREDGGRPHDSTAHSILEKNARARQVLVQLAAGTN